MILSLLIPTLVCRRPLLARLMSILQPQLDAAGDAVELLMDEDNGQTEIGVKRNRLLDRSAGEYVCFVDDDDTVTADYLPSLLTALESRPHCVGFRANWYCDGRHTGDTSYTIQNEKRIEYPHKGRHIVQRQPGHLTPVRRDLALATRFQPWNFGEDADFSIRLRPLLTTEVFIDRVLYHYWLVNRDNRQNEVCHPGRWENGPFDIEASYQRAREITARLDTPSEEMASICRP